ncbi:MAG TPA: hypothetical protein VHT96_12030 [Clostridia bacterium]|nr:hypothetical protein [Clostridia bacterium]
MKKINTIWYGTRILGVCGLFLIVIPMAAYLIFATFLKTEIMIAIIKISAIIGGAILLIFGVILALEFRQDRRINLQYNKIKYQKIQITDETYECQNCGSKKVKKEDTYCRECSTRFVKG